MEIDRDDIGSLKTALEELNPRRIRTTEGEGGAALEVQLLVDYRDVLPFFIQVSRDGSACIRCKLEELPAALRETLLPELNRLNEEQPLLSLYFRGDGTLWAKAFVLSGPRERDCSRIVSAVKRMRKDLEACGPELRKIILNAEVPYRLWTLDV